MFLISYHNMSFIIFKSFAYSCHLFLCFMSAYTLEVDTGNYNPKVLLSLYETTNYKGSKTLLSLYVRDNELLGTEGVVIIVRDNDLYKDPKVL